jgi:hypothetical protein
MRKKLQISASMVASTYVILSALSFFSYSEFDQDFIGVLGFFIGFLLLFLALPYWKIVYFRGRGISGIQSPETPPDEHLHHQLHLQYEKENKRLLEKNRTYHDVLTIAGLSIIFISLFLF